MDVKEKYSGYTHIASDVKDIEGLGINITEGPINTLPNGGIIFFIRDEHDDITEFHHHVQKCS